MVVKDFKKALEEGKMFYMKKYLHFGQWSTPKLVSAEVAEKKSRIRVVGYDEFDNKGFYCPYSFELAK